MNQDYKKYIAMALTAAILSLGLVLSTLFVTTALVKIKGAQNMITVTGSAKKQITSDFIVWKGNFSVQSTALPEAYTRLANSLDKVKKYLVNKGIAEKDLVISSISTITFYELTPNGMTTSTVSSYKLTQEVEIKSNEVDKIATISREATELINEGVEFQSNAPQYFYTKIADLKVNMLAEATKDAKDRAEQIASKTGSKIGNLRSAKMGVFQITPQFSTEVSDSGINDTLSLDKEITAVVTCDFEMK